MWQAIIDENKTVIATNDWDEGTGIPCSPDTPIGWIWNGLDFVEPISSIVKRYDTALMNHYDAVAQSKNYDNRITCALRAGYVSAFQKEGIAFGTWMDNCNVIAYSIMNDVISGKRELPSIESFIAELPLIKWPS